MHPLWRWILPVMAGLVLLALAPRTLAQTPTNDRLANLSIRVSPEYDTPSVYVQIDGELAAKDKLPRAVSILIPTGAELNATAYLGTNGDLLNTDNPIVKDLGDGFTQLTFSLPAPKFRVEYYYNPLQGSPDKTMTFTYKGTQPADNVQIEIQQPLKAVNFKTDPEAVVKTKDPDGFVLHQFNYATLEAAKPVSIKVSYTKTDPNPSVTQVPAPSQAQATTSTTAAASSNTNGFIGAGLVALALALAALGLYYWWSRNRAVTATASVPAAGARRRSRRSSGGAGGSSSGPAGFCPQCGRALRADDNFCPKCGTPRRTS